MQLLWQADREAYVYLERETERQRERERERGEKQSLILVQRTFQPGSRLTGRQGMKIYREGERKTKLKDTGANIIYLPFYLSNKTLKLPQKHFRTAIHDAAHIWKRHLR